MAMAASKRFHASASSETAAPIDDPVTSLRTFWLHELDVPDELYAELHRYGHVLLPKKQASDCGRDYAHLIEARRTGQREQGIR